WPVLDLCVTKLVWLQSFLVDSGSASLCSSSANPQSPILDSLVSASTSVISRSSRRWLSVWVLAEDRTTTISNARNNAGTARSEVELCPTLSHRTSPTLDPIPLCW
ncbi:hypothetical protein B0H16DRAFT_1577282, partial [Mycena metata]